MKRIVVENRLVEEAKRVVATCVRAGDVVVDATAGKGKDSVFLADLVGAEGRVDCFEVQEEACRETESRLRDMGARTEMHRCGHEAMVGRVSSEVAAVMFNLGYLPGSDHTVTTHPETTLAGLETALNLLRPGGVVSVLCYVGHHGGTEEGEAVLGFCGGLDIAEFSVTRVDSRDAKEGAPFLVVIDKVDKAGDSL